MEDATLKADIIHDIAMYRKPLPTLIEMALDIAYDNDMINRVRPESLFLTKLATLFSEQPIVRLLSVEHFCFSLSESERMVITCGDQQMARELAREFSDAGLLTVFLNAVFEMEL